MSVARLTQGAPGDFGCHQVHSQQAQRDGNRHGKTPQQNLKPQPGQPVRDAGLRQGRCLYRTPVAFWRLVSRDGWLTRPSVQRLCPVTTQSTLMVERSSMTTTMQTMMLTNQSR